MGTGVSISYLPIPIGIVLCLWWGPGRVLPAMYVNAILWASRWGLHEVDHYPFHALWEVVAVGLSWFVFSFWKKGKPWLPDLRETSRFVLLVSLPASFCNGFLVAWGLAFTESIPWNRFLLSSLQGTVATLFDTLAFSVPILLWVSPMVEERGWSRTSGAVADKERSWDRIRFRNLKPRHFSEIAVGFAVTALIGWYIPSLEYWFVFGIFVLWAALRYGITMALIANIWIQVVMVILPICFIATREVKWTKDGQAMVFLLNLALFCFVALVTGRATSDSGTELRKRRRVEARLIRDRGQYRKFFEENLSANFISDSDGNLLAVNASFLRMFRFDTQSEAISKNLSDLFPSYEDYSLFQQKIRLNYRLESHEEFFLDKEGAPVHTTGNYFASTRRKGHIDSIRGYLLDDTLRRKLESQLIESKKLETIGTLAGGIAHDFNNILQIISGYATRMELESRKSSDSLLDASRSINAAAGRGATIVRRLLSLARKGSGGFKSISLERLTEDTLSLLSPTFPKEIVFQKEVSSDLPEIVGDYSQLEQVIINLCINSRDAMPKGGKIRLHAFLVQGKSIKDSYPLSEPAEYVCLEISDNGEGMSEETRRRIFEPFFTTKSRSQGSGLGMSMVYGIIQSHEGIIQIGSELGTGTSIRLFFPTASRKVFSFEKEREKGSGSKAETVLLVLEEEPYLSDLVLSQGEESGIRPIAVNELGKISELFQKFRSSISLFVLDLDFPNSSLFSFLEIIRNENPELKIVVSGTQVGEEERAMLLSLGIKDVIEKPYKIRDLIGLLYSKNV